MGFHRRKAMPGARKTSAGSVLALCFPLLESAEELEVFFVFRAACRLLHFDQVVEGGEPDKGGAEPRFDLVRPDALEGGPFHEGVDIRLDDVLPDEQLVGEQVIDADVRHVVPERLECIACPLGVSRRRFNEDIDVQGCTGVPVNGEGGRADNDEPDLMFF